MAVFFQRLDPAWSILRDLRRLVIEPRIAIRLTAREHEENRTNELVSQRDDGFLVATTDHQAAIFVCKYAFRAPGGIGAFAQNRSEDHVPLAGLARFAFAGGFVVAGTDGGPGGEAVGGTEVREVIDDFDQDQAGGELVDARKRLQQAPSPSVGLHRLEQGLIDFDQPLLQKAEVGVEPA